MLFFKQKTAYELRISDWSSDVCSSDLRQSRNASQCARPMVKAGNRMWNEITNANCTRERKSGDSSRSSTWRDSAARGERRRAPCAPAVVTLATPRSDARRAADEGVSKWRHQVAKHHTDKKN